MYSKEDSYFMVLFQDFDIWKTGIQLIKEIYKLTASFPSEERYGLTSQLRRASTSILANFAEGTGRYTYADKTAKFVIARGECTEVLAFLLITAELNLCKKEQIEPSIQLTKDLLRMFSGLIKKFRSLI